MKSFFKKTDESENNAEGKKLSYKKIGLLAAAVAASFAVVWTIKSFSQFQPQASVDEKRAAGIAIEKIFSAQIISIKPLTSDPNGTVAWVLKTPNSFNIAYTSGYKTDVVMAGIAWDGKTKENLTDKLITPEMIAANAQAAGIAPQATAAQPIAATGTPTAQTGPMMVGDFKGPIPESIKAVDALKGGVKYGNAPIEKTLFVLFDPRCPYCKQTFKQQQQYIDKGFAFKWIPVLALGDDQIVANQIATVINSKNPQEELTSLMNGTPNPVQIAADPNVIKILRDNDAFFRNVFKINGGQAGVPTAFFINHKTGKPEMMQGISEAYVLKNIFGE